MKAITKINLLQVIVGMTLAGVFSLPLGMDLFGLIPSVITGVIWGGFAATGGKYTEYRDTQKAFWSAVAGVAAGAAIMGLILLWA